MRSLRRLFAGAPAPASRPDAVPYAAAMLLAEMARVDHDIQDIDLVAAREALQQLFALTAPQADALLDEASHPGNRPTSYHGLASVLNGTLSAHDRARLIEHMWRVAHVDDEVDMYEDHLVRKIADLLYVPHRELIAARQRIRNGTT
jgi:uncharacterized tellurite resistance protein B-like protein